MKFLDGKKYYSIKDIAELSNRSYQNVFRLVKISEEREACGKEGIFPKPVMVCGSKNWIEDVVDTVVDIVKNPPKNYTVGSSFYKSHAYTKLKNENSILRAENEKLRKKVEQLTNK